MDIEEANSNVNGTPAVEDSMKVPAMIYPDDIFEDDNEQLIQNYSPSTNKKKLISDSA